MHLNPRDSPWGSPGREACELSEPEHCGALWGTMDVGCHQAHRAGTHLFGAPHLLALHREGGPGQVQAGTRVRRAQRPGQQGENPIPGTLHLPPDSLNSPQGPSPQTRVSPRDSSKPGATGPPAAAAPPHRARSCAAPRFQKRGKPHREQSSNTKTKLPRVKGGTDTRKCVSLLRKNASRPTRL